MRLEVMAKEAKNALILRSSGIVNANGFDNSASVFSKRGEKRVNQDCLVAWEHCKINSFCSGIAALTIIRQMVPDDFRSYWVFLGSRNSDQKSLMPR
ncbi:hypothetical protein RHMOL_Rhmol12G0148500 [Rhododendron molle]|uniref:Uncharacterized protein n=1 Tax=Rhododendron molle TaxID=49168 RepID=A0ACC0LIH0_RHOML|nr:hypothetical protein RHMOL_Rhmol12G0148500 [Rhododendron molle]